MRVYSVEYAAPWVRQLTEEGGWPGGYLSGLLLLLAVDLAVCALEFWYVMYSSTDIIPHILCHKNHLLSGIISRIIHHNNKTRETNPTHSRIPVRSISQIFRSVWS